MMAFSISRVGGWDIEPDFGVLNGIWLKLRDLFLAPCTRRGANDFAEHAGQMRLIGKADPKGDRR